MPDGSDRPTPQRVCDVPIWDLPFVWPQVEPLITKALSIDDAGRYLASDVLPLLLSGRCRLWTSYDRARREFEAAMVTEVLQFPRCRECRVWLIGGRNMRAWADEFREMVEAYARAEGCVRMTGGARRGWVRVGGYRETGVDLAKEL